MNIEVCIPTRKRPTSLALTLTHVFGKSTLPDTGVAIAVDEDDEETLAILDDIRFTFHDKSIRIVILPPKLGGLAAVNAIMRTSEAEYVFPGTDDFRILNNGWDRHVLTHFLVDPNLDAVGFYLSEGHEALLGQRVPANYSQGVAQFNFVDREGNHVFLYPTLWCCKKSVLEEVDYYFEGYTKWWSDLDLVCSFIERGKVLAGCTNPGIYSVNAPLNDTDCLRIGEGLKVVNERWCNTPFIRKIRDQNERFWCKSLDEPQSLYPYVKGSV